MASAREGKGDGEGGERDVAVVFGGGGMKAAAFAGAALGLCAPSSGLLRHCEVAHCVGTSAGAVFALLLALEWNPQRMVDLVLETRFGAVVDAPCAAAALWGVLAHWGAIDQRTMRAWLEALLAESLGSGEATFADLLRKTGRHLHVVATSVDTRHMRVFGTKSSPHLRIADCVLASMAIPVLFRPIVIEGETLVDGGLCENLAEGVALDVAGVRRVVSFGLRSDGDRARPPTSLPSFLRSVVMASLDATASAQARLAQEVAREDGVRIVRFVLETGALDTEDWNAPKELLQRVIEDARVAVERSRERWCKK